MPSPAQSCYLDPVVRFASGADNGGYIIPEVLRLHLEDDDQETAPQLCSHAAWFRKTVGKVIGRHGRTAEALRTIFSAARMKLHRHVTVEILD
jgi:predicted RNA-binding protein YlqC (UPF0109 family)